MLLNYANQQKVNIDRKLCKKKRILMAQLCVIISPFVANPYNKHKKLITKLYIIHLISKC